MDRYKITIDSWDKVAQAYQERFGSLSLYNDTYDAFCSLLVQPQARLLEIGCGPGNIMHYVLGKRPDFAFDAIDASPKMVELAKQNNPAAQVWVMDCRQLHKIGKTYDGILCGFCAPYLSEQDCATLLTNCASLLPSGGIIYISAIEGPDEWSGFETGSNGQNKMYIYYHRASYLEALLQSNGFEVIESFKKEFSRGNNDTSEHFILIAKKN